MTKSLTTAIVLLAPGDVVDPALRCEMEGRGWRIEPRHDPVAAMAEVCLRERARTSRGAWGLPDADAVALIIADADADEAVVEAVASYLPAVDRWHYAGGTLRRDATAAAPLDRPIDDRADDPDDPPALDPDAERLSRAEIDMLLAETQEES